MNQEPKSFLAPLRKSKNCCICGQGLVHGVVAMMVPKKHNAINTYGNTSNPWHTWSARCAVNCLPEKVSTDALNLKRIHVEGGARYAVENGYMTQPEAAIWAAAQLAS